MCHLSISLPRGQDDYIIELNFNSIWILLLGASGSHLMSLSLGASYHSGHLVPLFLASLSSTSSDDQLINTYNISDLSLMDRYRDSLNPDSWGSSLVLGMILWLIIRSYSNSGILVCYFDSLGLSFVLEIILKSLFQFRYLGVLSRSLRVKLRAGDNP